MVRYTTIKESRRRFDDNSRNCSDVGMWMSCKEKKIKKQ